MTAELPEIIEALTIHPGDTLIVRIPTRTDAASAHRLKAMLEERLPSSVNVAILAAEQIAVYHPEPIEIVPLEPKIMKRRP